MSSPFCRGAPAHLCWVREAGSPSPQAGGGKGSSPLRFLRRPSLARDAVPGEFNTASGGNPLALRAPGLLLLMRGSPVRFHRSWAPGGSRPRGGSGHTTPHGTPSHHLSALDTSAMVQATTRSSASQVRCLPQPGDARATVRFCFCGTPFTWDAAQEKFSAGPEAAAPGRMRCLAASLVSWILGSSPETPSPGAPLGQ
ncbi:hypothetical protein NDU88_001276 [Pleurodeles waltl]|uniref:Uncharacterized protein n=1 Tax=Pleurodeles waltl TaxID=8319 RepID=A0AAV7VYP6_PLEWA|nr:hypothetical protein NDU88_001276 [Pleurodeles waltl]